ncbi:hypothetical protein LWI28_019904 [Acer negundo]|uniref:Uncharacterized protein n=1 Tax=Acer negundo TaxID=4023 RepID=A0AAD5NRX3_ACENE|nr:hypothetical protein LWI28_019904 [Acer negundo]
MAVDIPFVFNTKVPVVPDSKMQPTVTIQETNTSIPIKLDGTNYRIWSKCGMAKEVWDTVKKSYFDASYSSQVYEPMKKTFQLHQDGRPLPEYYNELNSVFM